MPQRVEHCLVGSEGAGPVVAGHDAAVEALIHRIKLWDHHPQETAAKAVVEAVRARDGNRTLAAADLGLTRRSLYNWARYLKVDLAAGERAA